MPRAEGIGSNKFPNCHEINAIDIALDNNVLFSQ
jgi:hypothetical protein